MTWAWRVVRGLRHVPATVRGRLTALLLVAAIPLCLMAGFIAVQNYRIVANRPDDRAMIASTALVARYDTVLDGAARALGDVARGARWLEASPAGRDGAACAAALAAAVALWPRLFVGLAYVPRDDTGGKNGGDGGSCQAGVIAVPPAVTAAPSGLAVIDAVRAHDSVDAVRAHDSIEAVRAPAAIEAVRAHDTGDGPALRIAFPVRDGGATRGTLIADLPVARLPPLPAAMAARGEGAWLLVGGERLALGGSRDAALPRDALPAAGPLARRSDAATPWVAAARDGTLFDYAAAPVRDGLALLVAIPAGDDLARAEKVLARRIAELGLLCVAGLLLVAIGANMAVVAPLKDLTQSVRRWRDGGAFAPVQTGRTPREIEELTSSFSAAIAALNERERQLRLAMTRQELLMQEIHHRVKNNLQIVASLMNLQANRIRQPAARAEFQSARDRIRALATLHRHLYAHGELHTINMRGFLTELCGQLLQAIGEPPHGPAAGRITLDIEAPELQISSDQAVPMALIVTEAVSNAAKYAFPGGRHGHIAVRLTTEGDTALLVIEDDGIGIPAGRAETETGIRDGIGLQLIRGFSRQLGGTLTVTEEAGTRYALSVTLRRARAEDDPAPDAAVALAGDGP